MGNRSSRGGAAGTAVAGGATAGRGESAESSQQTRPITVFRQEASFRAFTAVSAATLWAVLRSLERFEPAHKLITSLVLPLSPDLILVQYRHTRNGSWDDYVGLPDAAVDTITSSVLVPQRHPDLLGGNHPQISLMFVGPPGTGKTMLAQIAAAQSNATLYALWCPALADQSSSLTGSFVRRVFEHVRNEPRAILLLQEITTLLQRGINPRDKPHRERGVELELLAQLDQGQQQQGTRRCTVLATSSAPWEFGHKLQSRFDTTVSTELPNTAARKALFARGLEGVTLASAIDLGVVALGTGGYSGRDVNEACVDACRVRQGRVSRAATRTSDTVVGGTPDEEKHEWRMTMSDLTEALSRLPPPYTPGTSHGPVGH
eukprot:m.305856 g.305856  ORF g.305856 m.305856 type:complete len:375 (-) comp16343_c2_seq2:1098-2222(-)